MCKDCLKKAFPERDSICLENGAYFLNFICCAECESKDVLQIQNRVVDEDEDGEEVITYQHVCKNCNHVIANHEYRFRVEDGFQLYEMYCMLCGRGDDERSVLPNDPRQQPFF